MQTIQESIKQLHGALCDYIEATYHISDRSLIARRKELLNCPGLIYQIPLSWNRRPVISQARVSPK